MCYELSFLIDPENLRVYTASNFDSHSEIRRAWNLPVSYGAEGEWVDDSGGVALSVRYEDATVAASLRRWVSERWPNYNDFLAWLAGQETRDEQGLPMRVALSNGSLVAQTTPRREMMLARGARQVARRKFRSMREDVYFDRKKKASAGWSLRRLAAEGLVDVLAPRLWAAEWGLQPDGCFVAIHSLHLPGRGGTIAIASSAWSVTIVPESIARLRRAEERAERITIQDEYIDALDAAAEFLTSGGSLMYYDGQRGGSFEWLEGRRLSSNGVLRRVRGVLPPPLPEAHGSYQLYDLAPSEFSNRLGRGHPAALEAAEEY